ncbi:MAG: hypothetical protein IPK16_04290 [Anaerolineales bacterium]|nr:hypothetical protein [Anaerolineales bacterium]
MSATIPPLGAVTPWTDASMMNDLVVVSNTVWAATGGGALAQTRGSALPVKFTTVNGLSANALTAVANCSLPGLGIVFGSGAGLQIADPRTGRWQTWTPANSGMKAQDVSALYCDTENQFLVIGYAEHGIDIYDVAADRWRHMDRSSGLAANDVKRLAVAGDRDAIWVVSSDGVTVAAGPDSDFYTPDNSPLTSTRVGAVAVDAAGNAWLGGEGVLYRVDGERWDVYDAQAVNGDFPTRLIAGIAPDGDGTLWLGSIDAEICHFDPDQQRCVDFFRNASGMAQGPVTNLVLAAPDQPYYSTDGNGYSTYDGRLWRTFSVPGQEIRGNRIKALALDDDQALWIATDAGVQRLVGGKATVFDAENSGITPFAVRTLQAGAGGGMWVGGSQGASFFDGTEWANFTGADGLAGDTVQAIANDDQNRTWFGTDQGISVWNGDLFFNITSDLGLPSGNIRALVAAGPVMWIGSQGGGLYKFDNGQLQVFNKRNVGLPSDTVTALAIDEQGDLWIGTDRGVASFDGRRWRRLLRSHRRSSRPSWPASIAFGWGRRTRVCTFLMATIGINTGPVRVSLPIM